MRATIYVLALLLGVLPEAQAQSEDGLLRRTSALSPAQVLDRIEALIRQRGLVVFARIDHAGGAAQAGLTLRPTELLLFGHPKGGTPLMQCAQSAGIDLPLKALAWRDESGQTHVAFNDPDYIARRHGVGQCPALEGLRKLTASLLAHLDAGQ